MGVGPVKDETPDSRRGGKRRSGAGRRPGAPDTKGEILIAARVEFDEQGYNGATVRGIAGRAGVDAALVHHYFGTKEKLFVAAMEVPFEPERIISEIFRDGVETDQLGERVVRVFLGMWGDPVRRGPMFAVLRSAMSHTTSARILRQFVTHTILRRVMTVVEDGPRAELRAEAMMSQLIGMAFLRYVVMIEPLASASEDEVVALIGPILQVYIDGATRPQG